MLVTVSILLAVAALLTGVIWYARHVYWYGWPWQRRQRSSAGGGGAAAGGLPGAMMQLDMVYRPSTEHVIKAQEQSQWRIEDGDVNPLETPQAAAWEAGQVTEENKATTDRTVSDNGSPTTDTRGSLQDGKDHPKL